MRGALVTGASRGIGRATAIALSARGEKVAVHYGRRREEAERTLAALHGDGHVLVGGDLTDPSVAQRVVEEAVAGLGQVDVLVNNAGIAVASVAPGFVATERQQDRLDGADGEALRAQSPFGRVGTAEEVAEAICYLTSPGAQWASGTVLDLNGASHLRS